MGSDGMIDERSPEEISHRHFIFLWWAWRHGAKRQLPSPSLPQLLPRPPAGRMRNKKALLIGVCGRLTLMIGGRSTIKMCNCSNIIYLY